jgi:hypothetical protein
MLIQTHTDSNIEGSEELAAWIEVVWCKLPCSEKLKRSPERTFDRLTDVRRK